MPLREAVNVKSVNSGERLQDVGDGDASHEVSAKESCTQEVEPVLGRDTHHRQQSWRGRAI